MGWIGGLGEGWNGVEDCGEEYITRIRRDHVALVVFIFFLSLRFGLYLARLAVEDILVQHSSTRRLPISLPIPLFSHPS